MGMKSALPSHSTICQSLKGRGLKNGFRRYDGVSGYLQ